MSADIENKVYLSIILSCYNESFMVESNVTKLLRLLDDLDISYEIIIVDDFSQDNSVEIVKEIQSVNQKIRLLRNPRNMGKGFSIRNGILNSNGEYIIFTDIDMVYSFDNIKSVLKELHNGYDIVVGNRRLEDSVYTVPNHLIKYVYKRSVVGLIFNFIVRLIFGIQIRDTQSGLKGFNRETATLIFPKVNTDRFIFDVEIFILAKYLNKKVKEIPVHSTYFSQLSSVKILKYSTKALKEVLTIKLYQISGKYSKNISKP